MPELKPAIYIHGDHGDVLHAGFYLADLLREYPGHVVVHGTGQSATTICPSIARVIRRLGVPAIFELPKPCTSTSETEVARRLADHGYALKACLGYPETARLIRDRWRLQPNVFVNPRFLPGAARWRRFWPGPPRVALMRYSGANRQEWGQKNQPATAWHQVEEMLVRHGYRPVLIGRDDPYGNPFGVEDQRGKLSLLESLNTVCQCAAAIVVQSWPSTVCPLYVPTYVLCDSRLLEEHNLWQNHYFGRVGLNCHLLRHETWVDALTDSFQPSWQTRLTRPISEGVQIGPFHIHRRHRQGAFRVGGHTVLECDERLPHAFANTVQAVTGFRTGSPRP